MYETLLTSSEYGTNYFCYSYNTNCHFIFSNCLFAQHSTFLRQPRYQMWFDIFVFLYIFTFDDVFENDGNGKFWWRHTWCSTVHTAHAEVDFVHLKPCRCLNYNNFKDGWQDRLRSYTFWHRCSGEHFSYDGNSFFSFFTRYHQQEQTIHDGDTFSHLTTHSTSYTRFKVWFITCDSLWISFVFSNVFDQSVSYPSHVNGNDGCTVQHHGCSSKDFFIFFDHQIVNSHGLRCFQQHIWLSMHQHVLQFRWVQEDTRCKETFCLTTQKSQVLHNVSTTCLSQSSFHLRSFQVTKVYHNLRESSSNFFYWSHKHLQTSLCYYTTCSLHGIKCFSRRCESTHLRSHTYKVCSKPWQRTYNNLVC